MKRYPRRNNLLLALPVRSRPRPRSKDLKKEGRKTKRREVNGMWRAVVAVVMVVVVKERGLRIAKDITWEKVAMGSED